MAGGSEHFIHTNTALHTTPLHINTYLPTPHWPALPHTKLSTRGGDVGERRWEGMNGIETWHSAKRNTMDFCPGIVLVKYISFFGRVETISYRRKKELTVRVLQKV